MTTLEAALDYAARGWPVLPLHEPAGAGCSCGDAECKSPAKHPRTRRGLHDATTDREIIEAWWRRWPSANVGLRTGIGFDVLDIDGDEGRGSLAQLCLTHDLTLPGGPWCVTGGDGDHLYVLPTGLGNRAGFLPGCDWRGEGGYVVAAPSLHASGARYRWLTIEEGIDASGDPTIDAPLEPAPEWLVERLRTPVGRITTGHAPISDRTSAYGRRALESECGRITLAAEGQRNDQLNASAFAIGQLIAAGHVDRIEAVTALAVAAERAGLGGREIERTIASGLSSGMAQPRSVA